MSDYELIQASLAQMAERHGDPTEAVYARLFEQQPAVRELFPPGREQARGSMLMNVLDVIGDSTGDDRYGRNLLRAEIVNHEGLEVPPGTFVTFLSVVRKTFEELLGNL